MTVQQQLLCQQWLCSGSCCGRFVINDRPVVVVTSQAWCQVWTLLTRLSFTDLKSSGAYNSLTLDSPTLPSTYLVDWLPRKRLIIMLMLMLVLMRLTLLYCLPKKNTQKTNPFYSPLDFVWDYPGEPVPESVWILLKQETVSGSDISWAICKLHLTPAPHHSVFRGQMQKQYSLRVSFLSYLINILPAMHAGSKI